MPGDGVVSIGATFDKTNVDAGLGETQEMVKASMEAISVSVTEAGAKTKAAWKGISDDVKAAADSVTAESLKVAESSRAVAAAQADVRRAVTLTRDAAIPAAESMAVLAAAQTKLAAEQAASAAASKAQSAAVAAAAEEAALSSNFIIAGFQRASAEVRESLTAIQEKLVETAETGKLTSEGLISGFAGFGKLLGAGIAVGFAANFLDETAKANVELGILSEKTGVVIPLLAGLKQIARENGEDFEIFGTGLTRLVRAMGLAEEHSKPVLAAFDSIGIKSAELPALLQNPEAMLYRVAKAMAETHDQGIKNAAAVALMGRGGIALVPILAAQGAELEHNARAAAEATGATQEAVDASRRWTRNMADLTAGFHRFGNFAIENLHYLGAAFDAVGATFRTIGVVIVRGLQAIGAEILALGKAFYDVATFNIVALKDDIQHVMNDGVDAVKKGAGEIASSWKSVRDMLAAPLPNAEKLPLGGGDDGDGKPGPGSVARGAAAGAGAAAAGAQPMTPQTQSADLSAANAELMASLAQQLKETQSTIKQETEAYRDQAEEKIRLAHEDYVDVEKNANFEVEMGRMTAMQRLAVLRQAATQENQIRQQQMRFIQMLDQGNVKQYQADLKKEEQDTREFTRQIQQMHQQAALMIQKNWKKAFDVLNNDMITVMNDWIKGSKNMGQVFAKMLNDLIIQLADWVAKWLLHMAEKWAMEKIMAAMGIAAQKSTQAAANAATVTGDAGVAAANTMAYYTATDPPAAPAMAAAAFSATMAFMPAAAFDTGGMLQHMGAAVNLSGRPERVLDPRQTENFESMVNGGGGGGTVHNHLHYNGQVNAYDRNGMRQTLRAHADDLVSIIQDAWSSGKLHA